MPTTVNQSPASQDCLKLLTPILLILLAFLSFLMPTRPSKGELVDRVNSRLREGEFEELYLEAGSHLHLNVTQEKFVRRMRAAVAKLRAIDGGLNFRRDLQTERAFLDDSPLLLGAAQRLEGNGKSVSVIIYWEPDGHFSNIVALPQAGTSNEYAVPGVSYAYRHVGGQLVEE